MTSPSKKSENVLVPPEIGVIDRRSHCTIHCKVQVHKVRFNSGGLRYNSYQ